VKSLPTSFLVGMLIILLLSPSIFDSYTPLLLQFEFGYMPVVTADQNTKPLEQLRGLPFYDWSESDLVFVNTKVTTFNNAIGLPQKNGQGYPLFDYEQTLFD
jgi:hypothetical protein